MDVVQSRSEVFWLAFSSLSRQEREAVVARLLDDPGFRDDLLDLVVFQQRKGEPSRLLREYLGEKGVEAP